MRLQQPVFLLKDTHCIAEDTVRRSYSVFIPKLKVQVSAQFTQTEILHLDCMFFSSIVRTDQLASCITY